MKTFRQRKLACIIFILFPLTSLAQSNSTNVGSFDGLYNSLHEGGVFSKRTFSTNENIRFESFWNEYFFRNSSLETRVVSKHLSVDPSGNLTIENFGQVIEKLFRSHVKLFFESGSPDSESYLRFLVWSLEELSIPSSSPGEPMSLVYSAVDNSPPLLDDPIKSMLVRELERIGKGDGDLAKKAREIVEVEVIRRIPGCRGLYSASNG